MDDRWQQALDWFVNLPMGRRKVEYRATIGRALEELQTSATIEALQARYDAGVDWIEAIAREGFPDTPALWARERTADVAFGLRASQILGLPVGPRPDAVPVEE